MNNADRPLARRKRKVAKPNVPITDLRESDSNKSVMQLGTYNEFKKNLRCKPLLDSARLNFIEASGSSNSQTMISVNSRSIRQPARLLGEAEECETLLKSLLPMFRLVPPEERTRVYIAMIRSVTAALPE